MKNVTVWIGWDGLVAGIPRATLALLLKEWMVQPAWRPVRCHGRRR